MLSRTNQLIAAAAERLGVRWAPISDEATDFFLRLQGPGGEVIISKTRSPMLTAVAQTLSNNKHVCRGLLAKRGLPVVPGVLIDDTTEQVSATELLARMGEVIVKPNWGNRARGVAGPFAQPDAVLRAIDVARALDLDEEALVEPHVEGANLRIAVVGGQAVAATIIERPVLVGDGIATPRALVADFNRDPRRAHWAKPALLPLDIIEVDDAFEAALRLRGASVDTPLAKGQCIELFTEERETIDATDDIDPHWAAVAVEACEVLGIDVGGVDLRGPLAVLRDASMRQSDAAGDQVVVLEVNVLPALHVHALPTQGTPRPVFDAFVAHCVGLRAPS